MTFLHLTMEQRFILKNARAIIESGKQEYLCHAVEEAVADHIKDGWLGSLKYGAELHAAIGASVAGGCFTTLESWIVDNDFEYFIHEERCGMKTIADARWLRKLMRLAWIDRMLETGEVA